jgi:hypothetical protein
MSTVTRTRLDRNDSAGDSRVAVIGLLHIKPRSYHNSSFQTPTMDSDSDCSSNTSSMDMDIEGGSVASDNTDEAASMRSASPASVVAITPEMQFFREENGRLFNTQSDIYPFPADDEEMDRLSKFAVEWVICY